MKFNYKLRSTGERIGKISVEFHINREDMVAACAYEVAETCGEYEPTIELLEEVAAKLSKTKIETRLRWLVKAYGAMWQESNSDDYLTVASTVFSDLNDIASQTISRLYPELS